MAEHVLINGDVLTDEDLEAMAEEWENGTWEGELVDVKIGRPRLSNEPNANLSFKCPLPDAWLIQAAADKCEVKKSAFIREAAIEKARQVLADAS